MTRLSLIVSCIFVGCFCFGCGSNSDTPNSPSPNDPIPAVHTNPVWLNSGALVFENLGAFEVGPGWADVHPPSQGIVQWDLEDDDGILIIPNGLFPSSYLEGSAIGALISGLFGNLVVFSNSELNELNENIEWSSRSHLTINQSGDWIAWRSFDPSKEIGIWLFHQPSSTCLFVGPGSYPRFNPDGSKLVFRYHPPSGPPFIAEYSLSDAKLDTLFEFDPRNNCREISYSPDGRNLAYWNHSLDIEDHGVYVLSLDSGSVVQLIEEFGSGLTWGEMGIVYTRDCDSIADPGCGVLWLVDPESGQVRQLTQRYQFLFGLGK
jgi:hypothetical protein